MKSHEIRQKFLEFFESNGHKIVPSSSLVPKDDPTLLFTNAGMVQFKNVFIGVEKRDYKRAASSQKCVRAGGKHNDLETVGKTARHHTFFEMLGNFSFGDYFKKEAIKFAWEFLTDILALPKEKLWVTIYKNDDEAFNIWNKEMGVEKKRIVRLGEKDNFWAMGEIGPCGPCSEIIIDQGEEVGCKRPQCNVECECDRYVELWNLVFTQYNKNSDGKLTPLPKPNIDTGMGLERLAAVVQGVKSNFDTDLLRPIIQSIESLSKKEYGIKKELDISFRVISDHIRAIVFLLCDGVLPSNEGRGYVLRRIIRRAVRHGKLLGIDKPFLNDLEKKVLDIMKKPYPELLDAKDYVIRVTLNEEETFATTLEYGTNMLEKIIDDAKSKKRSVISGADIFKLYDTYGFPVDLTKDIAEENGLSLDEDGFKKEMEKQRKRARDFWKGSGEKEISPLYNQLSNNLKNTEFVGYDVLETDSKILAIIKGEKTVETAKEGDNVEIVLNKTPFYGEAGGQVGDTGKLYNEEVNVEITDTKIPVPGLSIHRGRVKKGSLKKADIVTAKIDKERRQATALNHSATHILQAVLREVLGEHVKQSGSLVAPDRLRFDYTHFSKLTKKEIDRIEKLVNEKIISNSKVEKKILPLNEALNEGAIALFGEKYGEEVRVVKTGDLSTELCGGTHINATGEIGLFKIISEGGIASGVRRIEAVTGLGAYEYIKREEEVLHEIEEILKAKPFEESQKVKRLAEYSKELEKEVRTLKERLTKGEAFDLESKIKLVDGIKVLATKVEPLDIPALRNFLDNCKERIRSGVVVIATITDNKVVILTGVTKDLISRLNAGRIINDVAAIVGGKGGGRPDMAQAGGKDPSKLKDALNSVHKIVKKHLSLNKNN
ncbi:MAG TPA: alanine--tRNA ligase [Nitrospinota bacterium]|nr:alanine--tRNA ligase [Nitrospinota bacterium]